MLVPVILSGGSGTRLWPLSRELYPKQLLPLVAERTMLQETALRVDGVADVGPPLVVCNESHRFMVAEQLRELGVAPGAIVLEPVGRNTAPAVAAALIAIAGAEEASDPVLLLLPADHVIRDVAAFRAAVAIGRAARRPGGRTGWGSRCCSRASLHRTLWELKSSWENWFPCSSCFIRGYGGWGRCSLPAS